MPWDPMQGERLAPAWTAAMKLLDDGEWHPWEEVINALLDSSDLLPSTCKGLVYSGLREGVLEKRGQYNQRFKKDHRMIRRAK